MRLWLGCVLSLVAGFISLSYEILWYRAYSMASGNAPATFGLMLGFYLIGIAGGAFVTRGLCGERDASRDRQGLETLSVFLFLANLLGFFTVPLISWLVTVVSWVWTLPLVALSAAMLGAVLPLLSHLAIRPDEHAGQSLSYVYLANILGSAGGSLVTGFVLLDVMSLRDVAFSLEALGLAQACALYVLSGRDLRATLKAVAAALAAVAVSWWQAPILFGDIYERLLAQREYRPGFEAAEIVENRCGVIMVLPDGRVYGHGAYDGIISTDIIHDRNMLVRAHVLAAMHPAPREVLMIGLSTGAWAQVIAGLESVERLVVVEINPGYLEIIARHPEVQSLLDNPKVTIHIDDGRRWLRRHPEARFDAIIQNTTFHWRAHITNLVSAEYLQLIREHLLPGGLFHYNSTDSLEVQRTATEVFPHTFAVWNFVAVSDRPLGVDVGAWRRGLLSLRIDGRPLVDLEDPEHAAWLDELLSDRSIFASDQMLRERTRDVRVITDDNMASEWSGPRIH